MTLIREVARRVFAAELTRSNLHYTSGDERAPNYLVTPTGAKCNRLFLIGVATEAENVGRENEVWRLRVADPTGVFTIYAGQYQPEAVIFISELQIPSYVAVLGKPRAYETETGGLFLSIRPEEINTSKEELRDRWVIDTAKLTLERIKWTKTALETSLTGQELREYLEGKIHPELAEGITKAIGHYPDLETELETIHKTTITALKTILGTKKETKQETAIPPPGEDGPHYFDQPEEAVEKLPEEEMAQIDLKKTLLDLMEALDLGEGTPYDELIEAAQKNGLTQDQIEITLKSLMDEGRCYEPKIGILKKV